MIHGTKKTARAAGRGGDWFRAAACGMIFVAGAAWGGGLVHVNSPLRAEVREATSREHFQAGGERSETVLREILTVLERIDERVARIESAMQREPAESPQKQRGKREGASR